MSGTSGGPNYKRRAEILRQELERRLELLEQSDDKAFGSFTRLDWILSTLLFFVLPLLILGLATL